IDHVVAGPLCADGAGGARQARPADAVPDVRADEVALVIPGEEHRGRDTGDRLGETHEADVPPGADVAGPILVGKPLHGLDGRAVDVRPETEAQVGDIAAVYAVGGGENPGRRDE